MLAHDFMLAFAMTIICAAAVALYIRFLAEISKQSKRCLVGYWVRLRASTDEVMVSAQREHENEETRAA